MDPEPQTTQETQEAQPPAPQHLAEPKVAEEAQGADQQQQMQPQEKQADQPAQEPQPQQEPQPEKEMPPLTQQELLVVFQKKDSDNDGRITVKQAWQLLEEVGLSIYQGSVQWVARKLHPNQQVYEYFTYEQFWPMYVRQRNALKRQIWESSLKYRGEIQYWRQKIFTEDKGSECSDEVAPKVKQEPVPEKQQNKQFEGDLELLVGDNDQAYNSLIEVRVSKLKKQDKKPYIKLILYQNSPEKAKQFEQKLQHLYKFLVDLGVSKEPDYTDLINEIKFDTSVEGHRVIILLTTTNPELLELIQIGVSSADNFLDSKVEADLQAKFQFNVDIRKFLEKGSTYSLYECFCKNYRLKLLWNALNMKQQTRELFRKLIEFFQKKNSGYSYYYSYNQKQQDSPLYSILWILMNMRTCHTRLTFNNLQPTGEFDKETKEYALKNIMKLQGLLQKYEAGRLFEQAMRNFDNKISFEAEAGEWFVEGRVDIQNLNLLLSLELLTILAQKD